MASNPSRRAIIGGASLALVSVAASTIAATAAPAPAAGISADLAALIADANQKRERLDWHHRNVVEAAKGTSRHRAEIDANDSMGDAYAYAEDAVAAHPVSTAIDLDAKMAFILANRMNEGSDWHQEIAADVSRIVATGAPA